MVRYYDDEVAIAPGLIPNFYRRLGVNGDLADEPGSLVVSPWPRAWWLGRPQVQFAPVHGRRVFAGLAGVMAGDPRAEWGSFVTNNPDSFLESPARWLVVHRDINAEFLGLFELGDEGKPRSPLPPGPRKSLATMAATVEAKARNAFGPPDAEEPTIVVWDLDRIRAGL